MKCELHRDDYRRHPRLSIRAMVCTLLVVAIWLMSTSPLLGPFRLIPSPNLVSTAVAATVKSSNSSYCFEIIAKTGDIIGYEDPFFVVDLGPGPSINDSGKVAFVARDDVRINGRVIVQDEGATERNFAIPPTERIGTDVQINNQDQVVWWRKIEAPGSQVDQDTLVQRLDTRNSGEIIARGTITDWFNTIWDFVLPWATLNNHGLVVFTGDQDPNKTNGGTVLASRNGGSGPYEMAPPLSGFPTFFPMVSDNDRVVIRGGNDITDPIIVFVEPTFDDTVALNIATSAEFNAIGNKPGISDDGRVVVFTADSKTEGPGIFMAAINNAGNFAVRFKVAAVSGSNMPLNIRVGVNQSESQPFDYTVVYLANTVSGSLGVFSVRVDVANPSLPVILEGPTLLVEVGDTIDGLKAHGKIQNIGVYDPINNAGQIVFWVETDSAIEAIIRATPTNGINVCEIELVDPVPDLLDSPGVITTKTDDLALSLNVVGAVAADGVTQVVIRVPATFPGEEFNFTILDSLGGAPSNSVDEDGALGTIGTVPAHHSISALAVDTPLGPFAFAVYLAPVDFNRCIANTSICADTLDSSRDVPIQITNAAETVQPLIKIVRPPVVLVHGIWDSRAGWDDFVPLIVIPDPPFTSIGADPRFVVGRVDYSDPVGSAQFSDPPLPLLAGVAPLIKRHSLGFSASTAIILNQIRLQIHDFKRSNNAAAVQADIVAHSLGGLMTRALTRLVNYLTVSNYGKGYVHKLITIGTPHLGTPLATNILDSASACFRDVLGLQGRHSLRQVVINGMIYPGAAGNMAGQGANPQKMSNALKDLQNAPQIPVAMIAGKAGASQLDGLDEGNAKVIRAICFLDPLALILTSKDWNIQFPGGESDTIVPVISQLNRHASPPGIIVESTHTKSLEILGFGPPGEREPESGIPEKVIDLLNTPLTFVTRYTLTPP